MERHHLRIPNADFIPVDRKGLSICDAISAAFAQDMDFVKLDVITFSWQKVLGGEGGHGVIVLSPRAVERLLNYTPAWPLPKIFCMVSGSRLIEGIFTGEIINTPSMLCVEDYIDALLWAKSIGDLKALIGRTDANAKVIYDFIEKNNWIANLAVKPETRSNTSVCLKIVDPGVQVLDAAVPADFAKGVVALLEKKNVALDIGSYRDAPSGLRIWAGATIERADMEAIVPLACLGLSVAESDPF